MLFTNESVNLLPPLLLHDKLITKTNQHTLLGIIFYEAMTFKPTTEIIQTSTSVVTSERHNAIICTNNSL